MPRMPLRERQERRKLIPFLLALRESGCTVLSVDRSIRSLGMAGRFGRRGATDSQRLSIKVPDCLARTAWANIWFEYDEFCHALHRAPKGAGRRDCYSGASEARRMLEIHRDLTHLTRRPTVLIRYGADPAKYDRDGDRCTDNPELSRGQRIELCTGVLTKLARYRPPASGELLVVYVGYAPSARSVASDLDHVHVLDRAGARALPRALRARGWVRCKG